MGFFEKLKKGLEKTKNSVNAGLNNIFSNFRKVDEEFLNELLEVLIISDVGVDTAEMIIEKLRDRAKKEKIERTDILKNTLSEIITEMMTGGNELKLNTKPSVILVVGVNGVGKTTTIGKLANLLKNKGKKVIVGAGDTFRAAAIEQLEIWTNRAGVDIVKHQENSDPAAVVFDAIKAALARNADVIICDTAGRLHNKKNLMAELSKIMRVIERELPDSDKEILLVLDATTGQNAITQAQYFKEAVALTGVVLTKLDGSAKGGVTLSVREATGVPIKLICVGEQIDDLQYFNPKDFSNALLDTAEDKLP